MSDDSPIAKFIEKNGEGVHHVAFASDDIMAQLAQASDAGVRLIVKSPFLVLTANKLPSFILRAQAVY